MYNINGKVYTDATFVDEIVHNIKLILDGIVVKNQEIADANETEESIQQSDIYIALKKGNKNFNLFQYDRELLSQIPDFTEYQIEMYEDDNSLIPKEYQDRLFKLAYTDFIENYEEYNNYYRSLNGLPDIGMEGIYLDRDMLPVDIQNIVDISKPVHEMNDYEIGLLETYNVVELLQYNNPGITYLYHLGSKRIDIFEARTAGKFDILYMPLGVEGSVANRFREIYEKEKIIYFKKHYSLAYKFNSEYYDEFFIIILLSQTATDLISEIPEWYIHRDIFDARTIEVLLTSNGVKYFELIPLKYQMALVQYLNKLVKYKSTNKNIEDLIGIFDYNDAIVYKYYLVKNRLLDSNNEPIISDDIKDMYELFFVRVPLGETLTDSITRGINVEGYNSIVTEDKWWNGPLDHDYVYESILKKDFTAQITKYMSIEANFEIKDYQFQSVYFLNMLFNNKVDTSELTLEVPIINSATTFKLTDLFILLFIVSFTYYIPDAPTTIMFDNRDCTDPVIDFDLDPNPIDEYIIDPTEDMDADGRYALRDNTEDIYELDGGTGKNHLGNINLDGNNEDDYNPIYDDHIVPHKDLDPCMQFEDIMENTSILEIDMSNRILGFNPEADLDYLSDMIGYYHSSFGFSRGYTLEDLGVENFIVPDNNAILTPVELMNIYNTNKEIHDQLYNKIINCNNEDEFRIYQFAFNYLFTMEINEDFYIMPDGTIADSYLEYIKINNVILYNFYTQLMEEENEDLRKSNMSTYIDQVINSIDLYLNTNLDYLYYSVSTRAWNATMEYLTLLINFFKSYKTQFLDISGTLVFNNEVDDSTKLNDRILKDVELDRGHGFNIQDNMFTEVLLEPEEVLDIEENIEIEEEIEDICFDLDGDCSSTKISYIELDGNKNIIDGFSAADNEYMLDPIETEFYDGSDNYCEYVDGFMDLDGVDASYIEEDDDYSYEEVEDWDGGTSSYNITEYVMDGATAAEQPFYADYCPQDKEYRFPDEVNYNPIYQGYNCNGYYAEEYIWYWQGDAKTSSPLDDIRYELDGGRAYTDTLDGSIRYINYLNTINEENTAVNTSLITELEYYPVNSIYDYNPDLCYYRLNEYTNEFEIIDDIDEFNYESYVNNGIYYSIESAIKNGEMYQAAYEEFINNPWQDFVVIT